MVRDHKGVVLRVTGMTTSYFSQCIYVLYTIQNKQLCFSQRTTWYVV